MFKFGKKKPLVLSQMNLVPFRAAEAVLKAYFEICEPPIFNLVAPTIKHATILVEPFSEIVDEEGGQVHLCTIEGHFEYRSFGQMVSNPFSAAFCLRLYKHGKAPCIATEGWHDMNVDSSKLRVHFAPDGSFKFAGMRGDEVVGSWHYSTDLLPLRSLPCSGVHAALYAQRITRLGYLRQWTKDQLLEATKDVAVVAGAEEILKHYGLTFRAKPQ